AGQEFAIQHAYTRHPRAVFDVWRPRASGRRSRQQAVPDWGAPASGKLRRLQPVQRQHPDLYPEHLHPARNRDLHAMAPADTGPGRPLCQIQHAIRLLKGKRLITVQGGDLVISDLSIDPEIAKSKIVDGRPPHCPAFCCSSSTDLNVRSTKSISFL